MLDAFKYDCNYYVLDNLKDFQFEQRNWTARKLTMHSMMQTLLKGFLFVSNMDLKQIYESFALASFRISVLMVTTFISNSISRIF